MRNILLGMSAVVLASVSVPAFAQDEAPSAITINGSATLVSDYRFRGISQTDKDFALQGSMTITHESGLYGSVWGSSVDDELYNGADQELDLIVGYKKTFDATTVDLGVLYYFYPGSQDAGAGFNSDYFEPYFAVSQAFGPVTAKGTLNYAPKQKALALTNPKDDNLYGAIDLSGAVPDTGVSLSAHLGHNFTRSFLSLGRKYTDWNIGASYTIKNVTLGVTYVDTNLPKGFATGPASGKDLVKAGVFGSIGVSF